MDTGNDPPKSIQKGKNHGELFMKRLFFSLWLIVPFLLLVNLRSAESASSIRLVNGHNWTSWSYDQKLAFISELIAGSDWVATNSLFSESLFPNDDVRRRSQAIWEEVTGEAKEDFSTSKGPKYSAVDVLLYSMYDAYKKNGDYQRAIIKVSVTDIVNGLNRLYNVPKNLKILVSNGTYLVQKQLKGASSDDINILLPYLRGEKELPLGWIIPVHDKNGKLIKIIEFP